ncbi:hypothetical protein V6N13_047901 [Hibiscus sabdariffa]
MDSMNFGCKENSDCFDSEDNSGYFCQCLQGYEGNPYLSNGCQGNIIQIYSMAHCILLSIAFLTLSYYYYCATHLEFHEPSTAKVQRKDLRYATGCLSLCSSITDDSNGSCSGIGCCQTSIPKGVKSYNITLESYDNHADVLPENPCSYAFVAENDNYTFSSSDIRGFDFRDKQFPVTLEWTIGNTSCNEAKMDTMNFGCKENSDYVDSENNSGYFCKCLDGYEGNPYPSNGCQDINECETISPCNETKRCINLPGTYNCSCPVGYVGDGRKNGTGCSPNKDQSKSSTLIDVALCTSIGLLGLLLGIVFLYWMLKRKQISKLRQEYFQKNGGILLREELSRRQGYREDVKVFAPEELEKATNNYHGSRILGQGGQGTVYKGILADNRVVAIKKSII